MKTQHLFQIVAALALAGTLAACDMPEEAPAAGDQPAAAVAEVAAAQKISPVGNGPKKHQLAGVFDCSQGISLELVQCKACMTSEAHGTVCSCYDCEREGDECSGWYDCTQGLVVHPPKRPLDAVVSAPMSRAVF
jgi:hypothetical protein